MARPSCPHLASLTQIIPADLCQQKKVSARSSRKKTSVSWRLHGRGEREKKKKKNRLHHSARFETAEQQPANNNKWKETTMKKKEKMFIQFALSTSSRISCALDASRWFTFFKDSLAQHLNHNLWYHLYIFQSKLCSACQLGGPNLWICLSLGNSSAHKSCHFIGCSDKHNDHSTLHFEVRSLVFIFNRISRLLFVRSLTFTRSMCAAHISHDFHATIGISQLEKKRVT